MKRMRQGSTGRIFLGGPEAPSGTGAIDPHKVPSRLTNDGIEDRCGDLLDHRPVIANRLLERLQMIGQNAIFAQENGMRSHACALFDVTDAWGLAGPAIGNDECSLKKSSENIDGLGFRRSGPVEPASGSEVPVASGTLIKSPR